DLSMRYLASAGAMLQLAVTAAALGVWIIVEKACAVVRDHLAAAGSRLRHDSLVRMGAFATMTLSAAVVIAGLATLAVWSVAGLWQFPDALRKGFTFKSWIAAGPRIVRPLATALLVALFSPLLAVALTLICLAREDETGRKA